MVLELSSRDADKAKFVFSIYDFDGQGKIDAYYLGDALRALNTHPTLSILDKLGKPKRRKEKFLTVEEFLPLFAHMKNEKESGNFEDFSEVLHLYDKHENGLVLKAELEHILLSVGEKMDKDDVQVLLNETCPPEDDDGFISYDAFLKKLMAGPYPEEK